MQARFLAIQRSHTAERNRWGSCLSRPIMIHQPRLCSKKKFMLSKLIANQRFLGNAQSSRQWKTSSLVELHLVQTSVGDIPLLCNITFVGIAAWQADFWLKATNHNSTTTWYRSICTLSLKAKSVLLWDTQTCQNHFYTTRIHFAPS